MCTRLAEEGMSQSSWAIKTKLVKRLLKSGLFGWWDRKMQAKRKTGRLSMPAAVYKQEKKHQKRRRKSRRRNCIGRIVGSEVGLSLMNQTYHCFYGQQYV